MGLVFREYLEFLDRELGEGFTEAVIDDVELSSGGAYASTGNYPFEEMQRLVGATCRHGGMAAEHLLAEFGKSVGCSFARGYGHYFEARSDLFDLLAHVDNHIHVEVRKLYPEAELPSFEVRARDANSMVLVYRSSRKLHELARGVILAAAGFYGQQVEVEIAVNEAPDDWFAEITVEKVQA